MTMLTKVTRSGVDPMRRRLLAGAPSSLLFVPFLASARCFTSPRADIPGASETKGDQGDSRIEADADDAMHLTVGVELNGHGPYAFVVDTGADRTVIADDLVNPNGMARGERVLVEGIIRSTATQTALISRMRLGSTERHDLWVPTLPRQMLKADGFLGLDVLDGHKVTFDFKNHVLTIGSPRPHFSLAWFGGEERIKVRGDSGHLRAVDCLVDGVRATAFLDTGAQVSACNSSLFAALKSRNAMQGTTGSVALSGVTGGEIDGTLTSVNRIQLEELNLTQCSLVVADFDIFKIWGLSHTPAVLIGMNLLRAFAKVSIDYRRRELSFELTKARVPELPVFAQS